MRRMAEMALLRAGVPYEALARLDEETAWTYFCALSEQRRREEEAAQVSGAY